MEFINSFNKGDQDIKSNRVVEFEPLCTSKYYISNIQKAKRYINKRFSLIDFMSYDYVWKKLIHKDHDYGKPLYRSCFVDFDNSARKGKKALIMKGSSPEKFGKYLKELIDDKSRNYDDEFLMINAWNEWVEGAMLEPDDCYKFGYLEAIKAVVEHYECK